MAGLWMGGMQTLFTALHHLDKFAYIASLSGPMMRTTDPGGRFGPSLAGPFDAKTAYDGAFADPAKFNARVKLFWRGAGSAETPLHQDIVGAVDALPTSDPRLEYFES